MTEIKRDMICIGCQCAQVLMGIKPSNILMTKKVNELTIKSMFKQSGIEAKKICKGMWLVFWPERLQAELLKKDIQKFLKQYGYYEYHIDMVLERLIERIIAYKSNIGEFPHEMGIFLGYPLEDVQGFIEHKGKNYRYSGYWKVYGDVEKAKEVFQLYQKAREYVVDSLNKGKTVAELTARQQILSYVQ